MSRYRSSSVYNQLLIPHIMSKIIFMKYLPPVRPKVVPILKMLRIYWNLAYVIFRISRSQFWCQFFFLNTTCSAEIGPKIKSAQNYWNLTHSASEICQSRFWCQKWFLINIYHLLGPNCSQNRKCSGFIEI